MVMARRIAQAIGLRFLARHKGSLIAAVLIMALALGANTAGFSVLRSFLLSSIGVPEPDRLLIIGSYRDLPGRGAVLFSEAYPNYELIRQSQHSFSEVATTVQNIASWNDGTDTRPLQATRATATFFATMRVSPLLGRAFTAQEEGPSPTPVVVISHALWQSAFAGDRAVVGRTLELDGQLHTIIGVMPPHFTLPVPSDIWLPFDLPAQQRTSIIGARILTTFGRLAPGVTRAAADAEARTFTARTLEANSQNKDFYYKLQSVRDVLLNGADATVLLVQGAALVLLLLAVLNLASLLMAWGFERRTELAVRQSLGASRRSVTGLLVAQSLAVVGIGAVLGFGLAVVIVRWLQRMDLTQALSFFSAGLHVDFGVTLFGIGVAIVAALLAAFLPTWFARRSDLVHELRAGGRTLTLSRSAVRWQNAMVMIQAGMSVAVLAVAAIVGISFYNLLQVPLGFGSREHLVVRVQLQSPQYQQADKRAQFGTALLQNLANEPAIASAAFTSTLPVGDVLFGARFFPKRADGSLPQDPELFHIRRVSPGYVTEMGIPLLSGRQLDSRDEATSPHVVIVSRALAERVWPNENPLGKQLQRFTPNNNGTPDVYEVVGVAGNVRDAGSNAPAGETVYVPWSQNSNPRVSLIVKPRGPADAALAAVRRALRSTDPNLAASDVTTLAALVDQANALGRLRAVLLLAFALTAALMTGVGCYGVMSQLVATRQREFAVRLAFGATPKTLAASVFTRVAKLTTPGIVIGVVTVFFLRGVMHSFVFGIGEHSAPVLVGVSVFMLAVAFASTLPSAFRVMRVDVRASAAGD